MLIRHSDDMNETLLPTAGVKIIRHHARHFTVVDTSKTPIKKLFESVIGMAEHHVQFRDPKAECEAWLEANFYVRLGGSEFWVEGKEVIVRWEATYETKILVPKDADLDSTAVKDAAANIDLDVPGSTYQSDTWEVQSITDANDPIHSH